MEIFVARHGQNEDNKNGILNGHRDLPLTPLGFSQAKEVAKFIKNHNLKFDAVLSSPLQRALETARTISDISSQPAPEITPLLIERDFGVMTGLPISSIKDKCQPDIIETKTITYFLSPEGAETFPNLIERAKRLLSDLEQTYTKDEKVLLVGHGDIGKMIYAAYYKLSWKNVLTQFHFGNSELLHLSPNSTADETHVFELAQENH